MNKIETKRSAYPTAEQIKRRRRAAGGLLALMGLTVAFATSPGLRGATASALNLRAISGESAPPTGRGTEINIGDQVRFTRASDGKVVVDQIRYGSDIARDASAANPDIGLSSAENLVETEAAQNQGRATVYRVPKDWGLEDISSSAKG